MPFWWYFYSALPRALSASLVLVPLSLIYYQRSARIIVPPLLFIFL